MKRDLRVRGGAAAVLGLVFAAGTAIGIAIDREMTPDLVSEVSPVAPPPPSSRAEPPNDWIIDRLDLTSTQRVAVDSVVAHYGARMSELQKDYRPRYRALVDSTVHALRALLTEDQRIRYDSLEAARERWRAREEAHRVRP